MALKNLYYFRGNANDFVGSNNGTLEGASNPTAVVGYFDNDGSNSGYEFSGGNGSSGGNYNRIVFTRSDFEYASDDNFSFMAWVKSSKSDATNHTIFDCEDRGHTSYNKFFIDDSEYLRLGVREAAGENAYRYGIGTTNICDGNWHHVVGTYSTDGGGTAKCYVDGILEGNNDLTSGSMSSQNFFDTNAKAVMGAAWRNSDADYEMDLTGTIGFFANFDNCLTNAEILNWYNLTKSITII